MSAVSYQPNRKWDVNKEMKGMKRVHENIVEDDDGSYRISIILLSS